MTSGAVNSNGVTAGVGTASVGSAVGEAWVPQACTLPSVDRPLRLAEFDELFTTALWAQRRLSPTRLRWLLDPAVEAAARGLAGRESACCSFFTFTFGSPGAGGDDGLVVEIAVPAAQVAVLSALADRAAAGMAA